MSRALATFALGTYKRLQEVALPSLQAYADRHGYELHTDPPSVRPRPASWLKLPLLLNLLDTHEEVLWVDADVVIVVDTVDVADHVPGGAWHAMVRHQTPDGEVPNCGVWYLRRPMRPTLSRLWEMGDRYLEHPWWEQAALHELLGYHGRPVRLTRPTVLFRRTCWLPLEWNSHEERDRHPDPRFAHATCGPLGWRLQVMRHHAQRVRQPAGKGA